jgi:hypothetical protein
VPAAFPANLSENRWKSNIALPQPRALVTPPRLLPADMKSFAAHIGSPTQRHETATAFSDHQKHGSIAPIPARQRAGRAANTRRPQHA